MSYYEVVFGVYCEFYLIGIFNVIIKRDSQPHEVMVFKKGEIGAIS